MRRLIVLLLIASTVAYGQTVVSTGNHRKLFAASGTTNHARQFNGTSDYLQSASSLSALAGATSFSLSFDLYWDTFANTDNFMLETSSSWSVNAGAILVDPNSNINPTQGNFIWSVTVSPSAYWICSIARPSAAAWHHYVLIFVSGTGCKAYVDGSFVSSSIVGIGSPAATATLTSQTLNLMSRNGTSLFAAGRLSSFAMYSGEVSSSDASSLASCARPTTVSSATLLYYWPINQTSPEVATTGSINLNVTGTTNVASVCSF